MADGIGVPIARKAGVVTTVYRERGFGFIQDIDTGISRFVHRSGFRAENEVDSVRPGAVVNYIPVQGPRGPVAVDVLSEPGPAVPGLEPRVGPEQQVQRAEAEASTDLDGWLKDLMELGAEGRALVHYLAGQEDDCLTTVADDAVKELGRQGLGWPRVFVISTFHEFQTKDAGVFTVGRRGHPSRFTWRTAPGPAARRVLDSRAQ